MTKISSVKTMHVKGQKQINASNLSWCEMALLKKKDPFMYYSIPGTKFKPSVPGKELDVSGLKTSSGTRRHSIIIIEEEGPKAKPDVKCRRTSFTTVQDYHSEQKPSEPMEPEETHPVIVKRKSAISFERCLELDDMELNNLELESSIDDMSIQTPVDTTRRGSILQDRLFSILDEEWDLSSFEDHEHWVAFGSVLRMVTRSESPRRIAG